MSVCLSILIPILFDEATKKRNMLNFLTMSGNDKIFICWELFRHFSNNYKVVEIVHLLGVQSEVWGFCNQGFALNVCMFPKLAVTCK